MTDVESLQKIARGELVFRPPASEEALDNLASAFSTYLPDDFRAFMSISDGLQDKNGLSFVYPVEEILSLNRILREELDDKMPVDSFLFFGNFYHNGDYAGFGLSRINNVCLGVYRWDYTYDSRVHLNFEFSAWLIKGLQLIYADS